MNKDDSRLTSHDSRVQDHSRLTSHDSRVQDDSRLTSHVSQVQDDSRLTSHEIAISVRNLSKKYRLYDSPQHRLKEALHPFRKKYHKDFWALKDVSFEVKKGETVGIIGKNGSGKSTLLQVICGTLTPTDGEISVNGRISALLELGAGFNPDFTGRQNIYMNGALIGFNKEEIENRFAAIAAFADIGEFIDQPVKTYSSGMYVRLAFAVAINIDPDLLVIDEALSVGDMSFQKKCMEKIDEFREMGKTIIFCSHDIHSIGQLCKAAYWINNGMIQDYGEPAKVINSYVSFLTQAKPINPNTADNEINKSPNYFVRNSEEVEIMSVSLCDEKGKEKDVFFTGEDLIFEVEYVAKNGIKDPNYSVIIFRQDKLPVAMAKTNYHKELPATGYVKGRKTFQFILNKVQLNRGMYTFGISVWDKGKKISFANNITRDFEIKSLKIVFGSTEERVVFFPDVKWELNVDGT